MADLTVGDVRDDDIAALDARAQRHGRTREDEVRSLIHEAAREERILSDLSRASHEIEERLKRADETLAPPRKRTRRYGPAEGKRKL